KTLAQLMEEDADKKDAYLELLVDLQLTVHSKQCPLLNKLKDKMNRKISAAELDATTRYELHTRLEGMPKHTKVCHGDFNPSNIIITADGTPYILDWSHATQGNASADVARTYLLFHLNNDADGAKKYLDLFCKKSDTAKQYVQKWMPIVAASQSVKGNAHEREFLLTWVDVVDYE
ncbi:MAG: phosphotransferase, partial [Clostridia bacterium]|nr:phosphotransferase [Clostridia bacterium]